MKFRGRGTLLVLMIAGVTVSISDVRAEEWNQSYTVSEDALRLANLIGEIQIEGHRGSDFEVEIHVRGEDAGREAIRIEETGGRSASLAVLFPVDREQDYVYPPMGKNNTSFSLRNSSHRSWWKEILGLFAGGRIKVSGKGRGMEIWADITVRIPSGSQLLVEHGVGAILAQSVNGNLELGSRSGKVEVTGVNGELRVDTGSGSVRVADVQGPLSVDTGSGSVTILNASGERVLADTGSGGVTLRNISCRSLLVDTGSGGITARGVKTESASLNTGSGSVKLTMDQMSDGEIKIDTGSGSIHLQLPPSPSAMVYASTGSGGISIDLDDVRMIEKSHNEKRFEVGGGGARIHLDTGSGSIRVSE